ncbi:hypothetical protein [Cohnella terricola]|uniref:hypothetical protein n=1 Tax=Cohnella terricola TaxID=1289167 RepID=UPI001FE622A9|nr:hypothetical protein [Cohnella terricola]
MNNLVLESPVSKQSFIWVASYADGTFLPEFSYDSQLENSFYDIEKDKLIRFGLVGYGINLYYEVLGGIFKIAGQMIEVSYKDNITGKEYPLTGQPMTMYKDIIQYKNAESTFDPHNRGITTTDSVITQYNFGYKQSLDIDGVKFHFKATCSVPYGRPVFINFRLVSDRDFNNSTLIIRKNSLQTFEYDAPLAANVASELNWQVNV